MVREKDKSMEQLENDKKWDFGFGVLWGVLLGLIMGLIIN